ncbi:GGDEF domain-containing protein [Escherichia coli]|nr:GGDEF domain-containing protein [Escherichia coli]EFI3238967.1 GGDEF domain-containing protein [Escherichia coli]EFR9751032.1 GGDEF domain-containing protein [Escherichia coli]ELH1738575.1 GGDEF domain-containing protein [Escherichia coli]
MEMYFKRMKDEWTGLVEQADPLIRAKAAEIAVAHAHYLSIEFYRIVRIDPHAEEFLSNEQVERQLKSAMERWIINVLSAQVDDVERLIQIQHTVAEVHARIGIPVEIVEMGFRVLKKILYPVSRHEVGMDVLTKLLNRRFLPTIFKREIAHANRTGTPLSVLIIDVDKFKEINDTWGHNTGDEILRKVSQAFYDNVRSSDYVFRYGGDEFIIVLTEASENETLRTAERIRSRVEKTKLKAANGEDIALSLSIGAAMFNGHPDYERLIQIADEALYIAKRRGRNRVELWKASL